MHSLGARETFLRGLRPAAVVLRPRAAFLATRFFAALLLRELVRLVLFFWATLGFYLGRASVSSFKWPESNGSVAAPDRCVKVRSRSGR